MSAIYLLVSTTCQQDVLHKRAEDMYILRCIRAMRVLFSTRREYYSRETALLSLLRWTALYHKTQVPCTKGTAISQQD